MWQRLSLLLMLSLCLGGRSSSAQAYVRAGSIDLGTYYSTADGEAFQSLKPAIGFDLTARYRSPTFTLGVGYLWIDHDHQDLIAETRHITGVFIEPRYSFPIGDSPFYSTFLMARGGRVKMEWSQDVQNVLTDFDSGGFTYGVGVGVAAHLFIYTVDLSAYYSMHSFQDAKMRGAAVPGTGSNGSSLTIRVGTGFVFGPGIFGG